MRRTALISALLLGACVVDDPIPPAAPRAVEAQFDPTHFIPVLRITPEPLALVEREGGGLDVVAEACERPSLKQCLQFASGWSIFSPITFFFADDLDEATIAGAVHVVEALPDGTFRELETTFTVAPRVPPPAECMSGNNGSDPPLTYSAADVPPGVRLDLFPRTPPLTPGTRYHAWVDSDATGGLRAKSGALVRPATLFLALNLPAEEPAPVLSDGTIVDNFLDFSIRAYVLTEELGVVDPALLSPADQARYEERVAELGRGLFSVSDFVARSVQPLVAAGLTEHAKVAVATYFNTEPAAPPVLELDPLAGKVPFPNVELLTRPTGAGLGDVQVALPIAPCDPISPAPGCDAPAAVALKQGLNTLDGFSTTATITFLAPADLDPASLAGRVVMLPVNAAGDAAGPPIAVSLRTFTSSAATEVAIRPLEALASDTTYALGVRRGLRNRAGQLLGPSATFSLLASPVPLIANGVVDPSVAPFLQCATAAEGRIASDAEVAALATSVEVDLARPRWQVALHALESATSSIARDQLLLAWTHHTQDLTGTLGALNAGVIQSGAYEALAGGPRLIGPIQSFSGTATIAQALGFPRAFCVPACQAGAFPPLSPAECADAAGEPTPQLQAHPGCQGLVGLFTNRLANVRLFLLALPEVTAGNPFSAGTFTAESAAMPTVVRVPLWVVTSTGTAPAAGRPAAVILHGFGSTKEAGFAAANMFASVASPGEAGASVVLIDLRFHGARASDVLNNTTFQPCLDVDPHAVTCDPLTGACTGGCDDLADPFGAGFVTPNFFALRDNLRQTSLDLFTLLRTLSLESAPGGALAELDGTRIGLVGQSLGGVAAGALPIFETELSAYALSAAGADLAELFLNAHPQISGPILGALAAGGFCTPIVPGRPEAGCQNTAEYRQAKVIAQWILDPADPRALAAARPTSPVLIQMARPDGIINNRATRALARGFGLAQSERFQTYDFTNAGTECHGFFFAPTCQSGGAPPVCVTLGAQLQAATFLASSGALVAPPLANIPGICP